MSKSTRTSDNAGHNFSDTIIAGRVRAEPDQQLWRAVHDIIGTRAVTVSTVIAAYRAWLLADVPPLSDEQISDRSAP